MMRPTIVDLTTLLPGAFCTRVLAQSGWRVIKVEPPGGDILRQLDRELYDAVMPGKDIVEIDLKSDTGRAALASVVREADALIESLRPEAAARLGVTPEALWRIKDPLVVASLRGYPRGPLEDRPGHDINYMAAAGAADVCKDRSGAPVYWGVQVSNFASGLSAAFAIQSAVLMPGSPKRAHVEIDLMSVIASWNLPRALAARRHAGDRAAFEQFLAPPGYGFYRTKDGRVVSLGVREPKFQRNLARALAPDTIDSHDSIGRAIGHRTAAEVESAFDAHDVPYAWVEPVESILDRAGEGVLDGLARDGSWTLGIGGLERWVGRTS